MLQIPNPKSFHQSDQANQPTLKITRAKNANPRPAKNSETFTNNTTDQNPDTQSELINKKFTRKTTHNPKNTISRRINCSILTTADDLPSATYNSKLTCFSKESNSKLTLQRQNLFLDSSEDQNSAAHSSNICHLLTSKHHDAKNLNSNSVISHSMLLHTNDHNDNHTDDQAETLSNLTPLDFADHKPHDQDSLSKHDKSPAKYRHIS